MLNTYLQLLAFRNNEFFVNYNTAINHPKQTIYVHSIHSIMAYIGTSDWL